MSDTGRPDEEAFGGLVREGDVAAVQRHRERLGRAHLDHPARLEPGVVEPVQEVAVVLREAHVHADELGDTFTDEMIERIDARLGAPERCPHGWPVDPAVEQAENPELAALSELEPGTRATIVRLAEHDGDLLHWFYDEGLVPGTRVEVREAHPAAGELKVAVAGGERAIAEKAAQGLYVRVG